MADGDGVVELFASLVKNEQGPGFRLEELAHLFHDGVEHGIEFERRGEGSREIVEDDKVFPVRILSLVGHLKTWASYGMS